MATNRLFIGEKIGFAAQITDNDNNDAVVTDATVSLQLFRSGATKPTLEFPMTYDSTSRSYVYVWTPTAKGDYDIRVVAYDSDGQYVVTNESVEITIYP